MKKTLITTLVAILSMATVLFGAFTPAYACELSECQNLFTSTLNSLIESTGIDVAEVSYVTEKVYDMNLNDLGCLYDFTVNETAGFAIMIYYEGQFEIAEIFLDATNPYKDCSGIKVYPSTSLYLYYTDGNFYDANTDLPYSDGAVATLSENTFCGGGEVVFNNHAVNYIYRSFNEATDMYLLCGAHPDYVGISGINNICVPIAASNVIGYWDRFKPNLIPNYEPGSLWNGIYFYDADRGPADDCTRQLATDMNAGSGTTVSECKSGMTTYCNRAGYSITYSSLMSNGSFNYTLAKNKLLAGQPVMIFSQGFSAYEIFPNEEEGNDAYIGITCNMNHAMAGFGFMSITYTLLDGTVTTLDFIRVATGQSVHSAGYYNIRTHTINDAFSVNIT